LSLSDALSPAAHKSSVHSEDFERDQLIRVQSLEMLVLHFLGERHAHVLDGHAELLLLIDTTEAQGFFSAGYFASG
jgi:hypothetical protein